MRLVSPGVLLVWLATAVGDRYEHICERMLSLAEKASLAASRSRFDEALGENSRWLSTVAL